jgi:2-dehydro-3-deoxyphosphogluconate aldolase/(4S)-4-hydroxy-2-oxoglutarate aldolase
MTQQPQTLLEQHKLIAIIRGVSGDDADRTLEALAEGGIRLIEVTMNTEGATDAIRRAVRRFGDQVSIGAGTVLDEEMARAALDAGAQYLISPNVDEGMIAYALKQGVPVWPGAMTPTEIVRAWKLGAGAVKVFPSGSLGLAYIKEIRAPLSHIPMIATGGVSLDNVTAFLEAGVVGVGIGGNLVDRKRIAAGKFDEIRDLAEQFVRKVKAFQEERR